MIKRALKSSSCIALGVAIGMTIPKYLDSKVYYINYPSIWKMFSLNFIVSFVVAFILNILVSWIGNKLKEKCKD